MLGAKKRTLAGFSAAAVQPHQGFVSACEVVAHTPPALRPRAVRLVAGKCALLARVDAYAQDPSGSVGASMKARAQPWNTLGYPICMEPAGLGTRARRTPAAPSAHP